jgi:hypothetical protein
MEKAFVRCLDSAQRKDEDGIDIFSVAFAMPGAHNEERNLLVARRGKRRLLFIAAGESRQ